MWHFRSRPSVTLTTQAACMSTLSRAVHRHWAYPRKALLTRETHEKTKELKQGVWFRSRL